MAAAARAPAPRPANWRSDRFYRAATLALLVMAAVALFVLLLRVHVVWLALLVFAGILIAVLLRALASLVCQLTGLRHGWSLAIVLATLLGLTALGVWLLAPILIREFTQLAQRLPQAIERLKGYLGQFRLGQYVLARTPSSDRMLTGVSGGGGSVFEQATGLVGSVMDVVVHLVVVFFVGVFVASAPQVYLEGAVRMFPHRRRKRVREVMETVGFTLRWWLIGQGVTMVVIGTATTIGLYLLRVPLALPLGILAGLFNFVPNFGPLVSLVPASLLALTISPEKAVQVVILYIILQTIEGYILTPMVQRRAVLLPEAMTLVMQVLLAWLVGALGLVLAAPVAAALLVSVKMLYVEDVLDDDVEVPGEEEAKESVTEDGKVKGETWPGEEKGDDGPNGKDRHDEGEKRPGAPQRGGTVEGKGSGVR
jgi:predicted PurR-regulated permease PerM